MWSQALSCTTVGVLLVPFAQRLTQGMSSFPRTPNFKVFQPADWVLPSSIDSLPFPLQFFFRTSLHSSIFHGTASLCLHKEWSSALAKEQSSFTKEDCWKQRPLGQLGTALITPNMIPHVHVTTILLNSSKPSPLPAWSLAVNDRANSSGDNHSWAQLHS